MGSLLNSNKKNLNLGNILIIYLFIYLFLWWNLCQVLTSRINLHCFKPLHLCLFVRATIKNRYSLVHISCGTGEKKYIYRHAILNVCAFTVKWCSSNVMPSPSIIQGKFICESFQFVASWIYKRETAPLINGYLSLGWCL